MIVNIRSVSLAVAISATVGIGLYSLLWAFENTFVRNAVVYHATVFSFFVTLYYLIPDGFRNHFAMPQLKNLKEDDPKSQKVTLGDVVYYSTITHAGVGYGDISPLTRESRTLVTTHVMLSFMGMANLVLLSGGLDIGKLMNLI
jgi:Ion channel